MDINKIGTIITESIRSQLASKGLIVRRTGYCTKTSPTVKAEVNDDIVEVYHHHHWDIGRWEIHGNYAIIPQSYIEKEEPLVDYSIASNKRPVYYFQANRTTTYSSIAGGLLLAVSEA